MGWSIQSLNSVFKYQKLHSTSPLKLPALGLGTSRLIHHPTKVAALRSLDIAHDLGITYYDTAPIYGFGWSEKLLGTFLKGKREKIQIATKIGLQPSRLLTLLPFGWIVGIRKVGKTLKRQSQRGIPIGVSKQEILSFDVEAARKSLEESLRRLKTDYVDILLLHEATVDEANTPEARSFMEMVLSSGKARAIGIGAAREKLTNVRQLDALYTVVQHDYDLCGQQQIDDGNRMVNTFGLSQNLQCIKSMTGRNPIQEELSSVSKLDFSIEKNILSFCLAGARYEHPGGISLFSSTQESHIRETVTAWNSQSIDQVQFKEAISIIRKHTQSS